MANNSSVERRHRGIRRTRCQSRLHEVKQRLPVVVETIPNLLLVTAVTASVLDGFQFSVDFY